MNAHQRVTRAYPAPLCHSDLHSPPEPADEPDFDNEVDELMVCSDTALLSYDAFRRSADEELYDLVPDGFCVDLILAASRCSDPFMRDRAKAARAALEDHATKMLHDSLERRNSRG
ncbi:MAG: hypothetical protein V7756_12900 [Halopseudomonas sp.]|uniref:hypothetical protein n=1 Tax=Halopseudomonas sp. TaxID=2901191 RepID=UPI00300187A6